MVPMTRFSRRPTHSSVRSARWVGRPRLRTSRVPRPRTPSRWGNPAAALRVASAERSRPPASSVEERPEHLERFPTVSLRGGDHLGCVATNVRQPQPTHGTPTQRANTHAFPRLVVAVAHLGLRPPHVSCHCCRERGLLLAASDSPLAVLYSVTLRAVPGRPTRPSPFTTAERLPQSNVDHPTGWCQDDHKRVGSRRGVAGWLR